MYAKEVNGLKILRFGSNLWGWSEIVVVDKRHSVQVGDILAGYADYPVIGDGDIEYQLQCNAAERLFSQELEEDLYLLYERNNTEFQELGYYESPQFVRDYFFDMVQNGEF